MGQIVIKIPSRKNRSYVFTDADRSEELIKALDNTAIRVKKNPAQSTKQQIEDLKDLEAARRSWENFQRTGISYTVDELREKYGL